MEGDGEKDERTTTAEAEREVYPHSRTFMSHRRKFQNRGLLINDQEPNSWKR